MKRFVLLLSLLVNLIQVASAQKQANVWCIGYKAGIDFNSGTPVSFVGSQISQLEGTSTISDSTGQLLFYSDGITVWNRNHAIMGNGTGLLGHVSSSQSAVIVKKPGSNILYYLFTCSSIGSGSYCYSIIDMTLNSGLGGVTTKNTAFYSTSSEKLSAAYHANGKDIWILNASTSPQQINAFLLTSAGLSSTPVSSPAVGSIYIGYLKVSPGGRRLAAANFSNGWQVYDFDNSTGIASNGFNIPGRYAYGVEFSPDETKLYGTEEVPMRMIQWDLAAGSTAAILASRDTLDKSLADEGGALQLGPDGKIYIAYGNRLFLSAIKNPNGAGSLCNYVANDVPLISGSSGYGLPNILVQGTTVVGPKPVALFQGDTLICAGGCASFRNVSTNATSCAWSFPGAVVTSSTLDSPTVCYNTAGKYDVQIIAFNGSVSDTLLFKNYISVSAASNAGSLAQSADSICEGTGLTSTFSAAGTSGSIQWQESTDSINFTNIPGATNSTFTSPLFLLQTMFYRAIATSSGPCPPDTSVISVLHIVPSPSASFTDVATGKTVTFTSATTGNVIYYSWDFGDTTTSTLANPTHTYTRADTFNVCLTVYNASNCSFTFCKDVIAGLGTSATRLHTYPVQVYPNPVKDKLVVENLPAGTTELVLIDVLGQYILTQPVAPVDKNTILDVSQLAKGVYFLRVICGEQSGTYKVVHY